MLAGMILLLAFMAACNKNDDNDADSFNTVIGSWARYIEQEDTAYWAETRFNEDGSYQFTILDTVPGHSNSEGNFTFSGNILTLQDDICSGNGVYTVQFGLPNMSLEKKSDTCEERASSLNGNWTMLGTIPFVFGSWERKIKLNDSLFDTHLQLTSDFKFSVTVYGNPPLENKKITGEYYVVNDRITFSSEACTSSGAYFLEMKDNYQLSLRTASEVCESRKQLILGSYKRVGY